MTLLDHGLVFIIAIVYPIAGLFGFRRLLHRVAAGESINRSELYRNTMIGHWTLLLICVAMWAGANVVTRSGYQSFVNGLVGWKIGRHVGRFLDYTRCGRVHHNAVQAFVE